MKIRIKKNNEELLVEAEEGASVRDTLMMAGINPETVIVKKGNNILLDDEKLMEDCTLEVISVVSGG